MKSIMQTEKECYITHQIDGLHKHHIYGGPNRRISEREGFYIYLIPDLHNMSNEGIHYDKEFDLRIKQECQRIYERTHTRQQFIDLIGKNYLVD